MEGINQEEIPQNKIDILTHSTNQDLNSANSLEEQQIHKAFQRFDEQDNSDRKMVEVLQQEIGFLRQLIDFQNIRIEKLTTLVTEFIENKNHDSLISSIQQIHDHNQQQNQSEQQQLEQQHPQGQEDLDQQENLDPNVPMDSNMDPALHRVAVAAVAAAERDKPKKFKRKLSDSFNGNANNSNSLPNDENSSQNSPDYESKKPKIDVNFLHNPTTVKEIYDEFTKGFKGQPPLCEMDAKYGKHEWRGDSRSKESKRYQRRKKLCDAIDRGMIKYNKSAEEIIAYIEEFRGDKSLTWIMNGNLPPDISTN